MRLIDVKTLELKEFFSEKTPPYAILSHTWGAEEVTFQDWARINVDQSLQHKEGFQKIVGACRQAIKDELRWLWCDTNCIDKSSSAELSEAINSMFAWYRDSHICYAYLADVDDRTAKTHANRGSSDQSTNIILNSQTRMEFSKSRWFTRGWTLQELLAPSREVFFGNDWSILGDRNGMSNWIVDITNIHIGALRNRSTIWSYSIAQRMSWAAGRETTRLEDTAYCLLGLFDINMPLLYGEGTKAFTRLQEEIIKISDDQSILAWDTPHDSRWSWTSVLARAPSDFGSCGSIVRDDTIGRSPYSMTNLGISINAPLMKTCTNKVVLAGLNCSYELSSLDDQNRSDEQKSPNIKRPCWQSQVWILLRHDGHNRYRRGHSQASKIYLHYSEGRTVENIFLVNEMNASMSQQVCSIPQSLLGCVSDPSVVSAGFFVQLGWGKNFPGLSVLGQAYRPGDFYIATLKARGRRTISHEVVSSGNFTVILSMAWDENAAPCDWNSTIIRGSGLNFFTIVSDRSEWSWLFEETTGERQIGTQSSLKTLHERFRHIQSLAAPSEHDHMPMVFMESRPRQNFHGKSELVVDIIFREPQGPIKYIH